MELREINIEKIAEVAHEINRAYCAALGDTSQLPWKDAPQWQKESAMNGVIFHIQNPDATPENSHENWLRDKKENGWKFGAVKSEERKEHPCLLPYNYLSVEHRVKDYLFKRIVDLLKDWH
jgi:hypothetical protein